MSYDFRVFLFWGSYLGAVCVLGHLVSSLALGDQTGLWVNYFDQIGTTNLAINVASQFLLGFLAGGSLGLLMRWQTAKWLSGLSAEKQYALGFLGGRTSRLNWLYFRYGLGIDRNGNLLD